MPTPITIESERLRVTVAAHFGARVTALVDKRSGRDWMAPGEEVGDPGEAAVYLGPQAVGWDECFPTVSPWDGSATPWRRRLRDHGDLWGRPFSVDARGPAALTLSFTGAEYRFERTLRAEGATLVADYAVTNRLGEPLPYLWALHALYAARPGERVVLPGVSRVAATHLARDGEGNAISELAWPEGDARLGFRLDVVQPATARFSGKFYASGFAAPWAALGEAGDWLEIGWNADELAHNGIWMTYGGWPSPPGLHQIALEATSASADHLGDAMRRNDTPPLAPGETRRWSVRHTLTDRLKDQPR
jgi:galactose mutarotase-like enzyme